jgi:hypothetical protein
MDGVVGVECRAPKAGALFGLLGCTGQQYGRLAIRAESCGRSRRSIEVVGRNDSTWNPRENQGTTGEHLNSPAGTWLLGTQLGTSKSTKEDRVPSEATPDK